MLPQCLCSELPLSCVLLAVQLLSVLVDQDSLAQQLCSHSGNAGQGGSPLSAVRGGDGAGSEPLKGYSEEGALSEVWTPFQKAALS